MMNAVNSTFPRRRRGRPPGRKNRRKSSDFGIFLSTIRRTHKYGQSELSRMLGCSPSYIHKLESGQKGVPQTIFLCRLAMIFKVPLHEILMKSKLVNRCDDFSIFDRVPEVLDAWRSNLKIRDAIHMTKEVSDILSRNTHRMSPELHHLLIALTKHVNALDSELNHAA